VFEPDDTYILAAGITASIETRTGTAGIIVIMCV
jgi:hypothetical protein